MPITIQEYNHTTKKLLDLSVVDEAANFYAELLDGTTAFDATHTTKDEADDSGNDEVSGNGWPVGGANLSGVATAITVVSGAYLSADSVEVTATGGTIEAPAAVLYVDEGAGGTTLSPLWYLDFGETKTAAVGEVFSIAWSASGIAVVTVVTV